MAQVNGAANDYYNQQPPMNYSQQQQGYNGAPQQQSYQQQPYDQKNYQPQTYTQNYGFGPTNYAPQGEKTDFGQTFQVEKPKWNDWWAGALFLIVFAGYAAVSGYVINAYATHRTTNGVGIYNNRNNFGLTTNTIVLFAFCLVVSIVVSYAYVWAARAFTKQFIWITGILNIAFGLATAIYMLYRK